MASRKSAPIIPITLAASDIAAYQKHVPERWLGKRMGANLSALTFMTCRWAIEIAARKITTDRRRAAKIVSASLDALYADKAVAKLLANPVRSMVPIDNDHRLFGPCGGCNVVALAPLPRKGRSLADFFRATSRPALRPVYLDNGRDYMASNDRWQPDHQQIPLSANATEQEIHAAIRLIKARRKYSRVKPSDFRVR